jgi:hypothetical protein
MENINTQNYSQEVNQKSLVEENMSQNKEKIANALNNDATRELAEIF